MAAPAKLFEYCRGGLAVVTTNQPLALDLCTQYDCGWICEHTRVAEGLNGVWQQVSEDDSVLIGKMLQARRAFDEQYNYDVQVAPLIRYLASE